METIGARIRRSRESLGMTQDELAQKLGYRSRSSINKIELDYRNLTQSRIKALADALDTTPSFIMGWDDEKSAAPIPKKLTEQALTLLNIFEKLDVVSQARLLTYAADLENKNN